jgi:hypothetical protein
VLQRKHFPLPFFWRKNLHPEYTTAERKKQSVIFNVWLLFKLVFKSFPVRGWHSLDSTQGPVHKTARPAFQQVFAAFFPLFSRFPGYSGRTLFTWF